MHHAVRMNVRTNLLLPQELVEEMDRVAGPRGRSRFVVDAVRHQLRRERLRRAWEQSFGILNAEDYPHWTTSKKAAQWVRELRAEDTDPGLNPTPTGTDERATAR
jgi:metal-responsive CopG/Arc/MetJ family transcriptional regulator